MPSYIVTLKDSSSKDDIAAAKKHATDQGGKIGHEYNTTFKGFAVSFDKDAVSTLESSPHVESVEADSEMKTQ